MANVIVACKLPNGLRIEGVLDPKAIVELNGRNRERIVGSGYGTTKVDQKFWTDWSQFHKNFPALKNGSLFVVADGKDVEVAAKDYEHVKTGFEPMAKNSLGVKAAE